MLMRFLVNLIDFNTIERLDMINIQYNNQQSSKNSKNFII